MKEQIGKKRILVTDDQRRRLAVKGKTIGRKALDDVSSLFTPGINIKIEKTERLGGLLRSYRRAG